MKVALMFCIVALASGLIEATYAYQAINDYRLGGEGAVSAGVAAGLPFFGVSLLAFWTAIRQSDQPDGSSVRDHVKLLLLLLVASVVWLFFVLLIWSL